MPRNHEVNPLRTQNTPLLTQNTPDKTLKHTRAERGLKVPHLSMCFVLQSLLEKAA
jgi:hypothetical protein